MTSFKSQITIKLASAECIISGERFEYIKQIVVVQVALKVHLLRKSSVNLSQYQNLRTVYIFDLNAEV